MKATIASCLALGLGIIAACAPESTASPPRLCTPGNYVFCRCKDRSDGTKLCHEDGNGFEPCEGCLSGSEDNVIGEPEPAPGPRRDAAADRDPPAEGGPPVGIRPKVGELFITEIMYNPSGNEPTDEWFEVVSAGVATVTLNGMVLRGSANRMHVLGPTPPITLAPNQYMVLVRNRAAAVVAGVPSAKILAEYGTGDSDTAGIILTGSSSGTLSLFDGPTEIARVPFGLFGFTQPAPGGASIQLRVPSVDNAAVAAGWCLSTAPWSGQPLTKDPPDRGSPGRASNCP